MSLEFQGWYGLDVWKKITGHYADETFETLALEHKGRIEQMPITATSQEDYKKDFLHRIEMCADRRTFLNLKEEFYTSPVIKDSQIHEYALYEKGELMGIV